jgi:hypothetical protein
VASLITARRYRVSYPFLCFIIVSLRASKLCIYTSVTKSTCFDKIGELYVVSCLEFGLASPFLTLPTTRRTRTTAPSSAPNFLHRNVMIFCQLPPPRPARINVSAYVSKLPPMTIERSNAPESSASSTFVVVVAVSLHHLVPYLPWLQLLPSVVACLFHQQFICIHQ